MKKGAISELVKTAQRLLNSVSLGEPLVIDGHFGPKTEHFVIQFQKRIGVKATGEVDSITLEKLREAAINLTKVTIMGDYPPFAVIHPKTVMKARGTYKGGIKGATVHFTAGHDGAAKTITNGAARGHTYWCIERGGAIVCAHKYNQWGYHAGESRWTHLAKKLIGTVSDDLIGIEMNAYGRVDPVKGKPGRYKTWFNLEIGEDQVRYTPGRDNQLAGYYHIYTKAQEDTLFETLIWLKARSPSTFDFDFVLGHDEVSGKSGLGRWRKNDPGAAHSLTMPKLREKLKTHYMTHVLGKEEAYFRGIMK